jgi:hypothetical protein
MTHNEKKPITREQHTAIVLCSIYRKSKQKYYTQKTQQCQFLQKNALPKETVLSFRPKVLAVVEKSYLLTKISRNVYAVPSWARDDNHFCENKKTLPRRGESFTEYKRS